MNSIKNTDIESPEWKQKLDNHLKDEDFFHTDSFPYAILDIKKQITIILIIFLVVVLTLLFIDIPSPSILVSEDYTLEIK